MITKWQYTKPNQISRNPFSGSQVVPCGQTDGRTDCQTDMVKLTVAFRNYVHAPDQHI